MSYIQDIYIMHQKLLKVSFFAFFICFLLNYFSHKDFLVSLVNSCTFLFSIFIFLPLLDFGSLFSRFLIISLAFLPLLHFHPVNSFLSFLPFFSLIFIYSYKRLSKKWILIPWVIFLFIGNLYIGEIIKIPTHLQHTQLIFNSPEINYNLERHQQDALFLPFKVRQIVYSKLIYIYSLLTNFFTFLTLKNLADVLLIANVYPLFIGFYMLFREKSKFKKICLIGLLISLLTTGIDRSPDKFESLYLLGPMLVYLIILGSQTINRKLYFALFILSFFILISPKI